MKLSETQWRTMRNAAFKTNATPEEIRERWEGTECHAQAVLVVALDAGYTPKSKCPKPGSVHVLIRGREANAYLFLAALAESVGVVFADWTIAATARAQKRKACCRTAFQLSGPRAASENLSGNSSEKSWRRKRTGQGMRPVMFRDLRTPKLFGRERVRDGCLLASELRLTVRSSPKRDGTL
jgi:hypothetical protein